MRCYGSLMGLVERAICERSPTIVSLKGMRKALQHWMRLGDDERFI
jgi:hypothetical protein